VDETICLICGGSTYVGETISCETCLRWFHFQCVGVILEDSLPSLDYFPLGIKDAPDIRPDDPAFINIWPDTGFDLPDIRPVTGCSKYPEIRLIGSLRISGRISGIRLLGRSEIRPSQYPVHSYSEHYLINRTVDLLLNLLIFLKKLLSSFSFCPNQTKELLSHMTRHTRSIIF
jgi:hypothetical protein